MALVFLLDFLHRRVRRPRNANATEIVETDLDGLAETAEVREDRSPADG